MFVKNQYEINGDVVTIFINSPKYGKLETLVSVSKMDKLTGYTGSIIAIWCPSIKGFYAVGSTYKDNRRKINFRLNRLVMGFPDISFDVDHKNGDTLNNTDGNLRILTRSENNQNRGKSRKGSKSGCIGVSWLNRERLWIVRVTVNKRMVFKKYFKDLEEAKEASREARSKYMPFSKEAEAKNV